MRVATGATGGEGGVNLRWRSEFVGFVVVDQRSAGRRRAARPCAEHGCGHEDGIPLPWKRESPPSMPEAGRDDEQACEESSVTIKQADDDCFELALFAHLDDEKRHGHGTDDAAPQQ